MKGNFNEQHRLSRWRRRYRFGAPVVCWRILKFKRSIKNAHENLALAQELQAPNGRTRNGSEDENQGARRITQGRG